MLRRFQKQIGGGPVITVQRGIRYYTEDGIVVPNGQQRKNFEQALNALFNYEDGIGNVMFSLGADSVQISYAYDGPEGAEWAATAIVHKVNSTGVSVGDVTLELL